jgi:hypothetical protein
VSITSSTKNTSSVFQVIPTSEISGRKPGHQSSENFILTMLSPGRFHDGPVVCRLLLLAKCIDGHDQHRGIVNERGVRPLSIVGLLISLVWNVLQLFSHFWSWNVYLTISLDTAGLHRFPTFREANKSGFSGRGSTCTPGSFLSFSPLLSET